MRRSSAPPTARPTSSVIDLSLPVMDGWETTRRLPGECGGAIAGHVVLTRHVLHRHPPRCEDIGSTRPSSKPCLPDALEREMRASWINQPARRAHTGRTDYKIAHARPGSRGRARVGLVLRLSVGRGRPGGPGAAQPERPTVATHAWTVAPGWIEVESGGELDRFEMAPAGPAHPSSPDRACVARSVGSVYGSAIRPPDASSSALATGDRREVARGRRRSSAWPACESCQASSFRPGQRLAAPGRTRRTPDFCSFRVTISVRLRSISTSATRDAAATA